MTDAMGPDGLDELPIRTAEAAAALEGLKAPAERAAASIEDAFGRAGESLVRSLARAAADGEVTMQELARAVLAAVNALAGGRNGGGLSEALSALFQGMSGGFGGARADGGLVTAGGAYLVGEHGPEVFRPSAAGEISAPGGGGMVVNVTVQGGPEALLRSEAQIARMLARAAALGARGL